MEKYLTIGKRYISLFYQSQQNVKKMQTQINHGKINEGFLSSLDGKEYQLIVGSIAKDYGVSIDQATDEVIDDEAENILDYLRGNVRAFAHILYTKWLISKSAK